MHDQGNWWDTLVVRRDKHTGKVLVKSPRSNRWMDAYALYGPKEVLVLDLVAGSRERERREKARGGRG
jgi:hypothetical protein